MTGLAEVLWRMQMDGAVRVIRLATPLDLDGFVGELSRCHENVDRWVAKQPGHKAVRGWLITGNGVFVKHSVVDTGAGLLDVTPRLGANSPTMLDFIAWKDEFDRLPHQVIYPFA